MSRSRLVVRNVAVTLATQLLSWALTFAVTLYLPRYVGDVGLGQLTFAASFVAVFGVFVPLGTSTVLIKEIARDRSRTGELLLAAVLLRVPLGLAATALAIGVAYALGYHGVIRTLIVVASLGMVVGTVNDVLSSALQGQENMPRQSVALLIEKFLSSGLTIALIFRHAPLWALAAVGLFTGMVSLLVNLTAFRQLLTPPDQLRRRAGDPAWAGPLFHGPTLRTLLAQIGWPTRGSLRALALAGLPFMGWTVFRTLYGQTDPIVLKLLTNDATVGWYSAAFRLVGTTLFVPTAITTALLPTLSRLHRESEADFTRMARRTFALVMLCGIPIAFALMAVPDQLIALLHYPKSFAHSAPVLRVGGMGVLLWFAASVLGTLVIARDDQAKMFRASVWATLLGIPACALGTWLGSRMMGNGAVGAIASDAALEVFLLAAYLRMLPCGLFDGQSLSLLARTAAASALMAGLLALAVRETNWGLWAVLPCAAVYLCLCLVLRCLGPQDMIVARQMLARKAGAGGTSS